MHHRRVAARALPLSIALSLPTLLIATATAQNHVVSPTTFTLHEGGTNNTYPIYGAQSRYQQLHGDLKGMPRLLLGMGLRRDAMLPNTTSYGPRTLDVEVLMGDGDFATYSTTFATNYVNTPTTVFMRKNVNAPDHAAMPDFLPAAWDLDFMFDTPWVYLAQKDLLWELRMYANTNSGSYPLDAASGNDITVIGGFDAPGTGCTTANGTMKLRSNITSSPPAALTLGWSVSGAASNAATVVLLGLTDPAAPFPGLCSQLHTEGSLPNIAGTTSSNGTLLTPSFALTWSPLLVGFRITAQAASVDPTQGGLGLAVSNGNNAPLPPLSTNYPISRVYALGSTTATTGSRESYNYGLVTRFLH